MPRQLQPELLDALPPEHPDAAHSRRDLRLINALMGNHRWMVRTLDSILRADERILEIGAGTGELSRRLAAQGRTVDGLDLTPRPSAWPNDREWHGSNLLTFDGYTRYDAVIGNLIFHHFTDRELVALGRSLRDSSVRVIVACEPTRSRFSQRLFAFVAPVFRANQVTLHDARVSIAAGFLADELSALLGLTQPAWVWRCHCTMLGSYRMVARRIYE